MKRYVIIFSLLLVFILLGSSCASAAAIDDSTQVMTENEKIDLSQGDDIDLKNGCNPLSQDDSIFNKNLQEESVKEVGSLEDKLIYDVAADVGSDERLILEKKNALSSVDANSVISDNKGVSTLPDLVITAKDLKELDLCLKYMQTTNKDSKKKMNEQFRSQYGWNLPLEHTNVIHLDKNISTIKDKLKITIDSNMDIVFDGNGKNIDLSGSSKHDHYFIVKSGKIIFKNTCFSNAYNKDGDKGGAISFEGNAVGTVIGCRFEKCWAEDNGGAISDRTGNTLTIINSTFIENEAEDDDGGAVWCKGHLIIIGCSFQSNKAEDWGGAVYAKSSLLVDGCNFTDNKVENSLAYGGAIRAKSIAFTSAPSRFERNKGEYGGAITAEKFTSSLENVLFKDNIGEIGGAILVHDDSDLTCKFCAFINNTATGSGGAVYAWEKGQLNFTSCLFSGNTVKDDTGVGGAIAAHSSSATLYNNVFVNIGKAFYGKLVFSVSKIIVGQNWYGTNSPNFKNLFNQDYSTYVQDQSYAVCDIRSKQNFEKVLFEIFFKTKAGDDLKNPLCLPKEYISSRVMDNVGVIEKILVEDGIIKITAIPQKTGYFYTDSNVFNFNIRGKCIVKDVDPNLSVHVNDTVHGDLDAVIVEVFLTESFTGNVTVEFLNENSTVEIVNGHGSKLYWVPDLAVGTYGVKAFFEGYNILKSQEKSTEFNILEKTTPESTIEFRTLQNLINHHSLYDHLHFDDGEFHITEDVVFSSVNDLSFIGGIVISEDNLIISGDGHSIDGKNLARIFDIRAKNVTIKNLKIINGFSCENGGGILSQVPCLIENCTFLNNYANNGGAVYFVAEGTVVDSDFNNNTAQNGGAIFSAGENGLFVNGSEFYYNYAQSGSAIYVDSFADLKNCIFLKNKGDARGMEMTIEDSMLKVIFVGSNSYANAIFAREGNAYFENVTYWYDGEVNSDNIKPEYYSTPGIEINIDVWAEIFNMYVATVNRTTDSYNEIYYNPVDLKSWNYTFKAYHPDDDYYTSIGINLTYHIVKNSSSVNIDIPDGKVFVYPDVPKKINFTIVNRSADVRVVISNQDGIILDQLTNDDYVLINGLTCGDYSITVFNVGNMEIAPSQDAKSFKISLGNDVGNSTDAEVNKTEI